MNVGQVITDVQTLHQGRVRVKKIKDFMRTGIRIPIPSLTKEQKQMVDEVWKGIHVDYQYFAFFNLFNEKGRTWTPLYVPSNMYYSFIDIFYSQYQRARTLEDKNLNNLLFYDVKQPQTVARQMAGAFFDREYKSIKFDDMHSLFTEGEEYIIKPSIDTGAGKKIVFWKPQEHQTIADLMDVVRSFKDDFVIQKIATQHEEISALHRDSINTIRITTFFHNGESKVLSSILRMGVGGSRMDNATIGGIFCGIKDDGRFKPIAYNDYGESFDVHPTTKESFSNHYVPNFTELKRIAVSLQNRLVQSSKLVSWDFAIDKDGDPILIECNPSYGGLSFHQQCNGPLFGDLTEEVIGEVFNKKNKILSHLF